MTTQPTPDASDGYLESEVVLLNTILTSPTAGQLAAIAAHTSQLRAENARLLAEIERWRDSNIRLRFEMENQAKRANNAELEQTPKEPTPGLLMSMALRYDHGLGCPGYYDQPIYAVAGVTHKQRLEGTLVTMRQIYEEVAGCGFYTKEREAEYAALAVSAAQ